MTTSQAFLVVFLVFFVFFGFVWQFFLFLRVGKFCTALINDLKIGFITKNKKRAGLTI